MSDKIAISVVFPAYNEEAVVASTVEEALRVLEQDRFAGSEVIVVNDGSTDRTAELAEAAGARVVHHPENVGYGRSLKDGIKAAKSEIIVIADADGTYPLDQIPGLLAELEKGFDMVVGQRTGPHYRESAFKAPLRRILKLLVEFTAGRGVPDINSGLRVFRKSDVLPYFKHLCDNFSFTTSLTLSFMMTGKFVGYVPVPYHERIGPTKVRLVRDSLRTLQYIVEAILYYNPIKIFIVMSVIIFLFAVFSFGVAFLFQLRSAFLIGVGSVLMTFLVFSLGLLAVLLRQIMDK